MTRDLSSYANDPVAARANDDSFAAQLRGFGPLGIFATLVILFSNLQLTVGASAFPLILPFSAVFVLLWTWRSRTPWRDIGYVRPRNWIVTIAFGIVFGIVFKFLIKAIVMPLIGTDPINQSYHFLAGNRAAIPYALFGLTIGAGFGEETVFRGYLFERLRTLLGSGIGATSAIVLITSTWFAFGHYSNQGLAGVEQAMLTGLAFAIIRIITDKIWMAMFAHAAFDLTAYALIYWNLETRVAHFVFK